MARVTRGRGSRNPDRGGQTWVTDVAHLQEVLAQWQAQPDTSSAKASMIALLQRQIAAAERTTR